MKPKRIYRKIDAITVARFLAERAIVGNATAAVRNLEPGIKSPDTRGVHIAAKSRELVGVAYVNDKIDTLSEEAIDRIGELIHSADAHVATKNAHFVVDHARGKAVQRTENKNVNLNIQSVLD